MSSGEACLSPYKKPARVMARRLHNAIKNHMALIDNKAVFSKQDFKYVFALTALAWLTYTMPAVQAALAG